MNAEEIIKLAMLQNELTEEKARNKLFSDCLHRGLQMWQKENPDSDVWISGDKNIKWMLDKITTLNDRLDAIETAYREYLEEEKNPEIYNLGERMRTWDKLTAMLGENQP